MTVILERPSNKCSLQCALALEAGLDDFEKLGSFRYLILSSIPIKTLAN